MSTRRQFLGDSAKVAAAARTWQFMRAVGSVAALSKMSETGAFAADPDFSMVFLTDAQYLAAATSAAGSGAGSCADGSGSTRYLAMMNGGNGILAHWDSWNVKLVASLGDCADQVASGSLNSQETVVTNAYNLLFSAGKPVCPCIGNHDYTGTSRTVGYAWSNGIFKPSNMATVYGSGIDTGAGDRSYWGGQYSSADGANTFTLHHIGSWRIGVMSLEHFARSSRLNWAYEVMSSLPNYSWVIITHGFLDLEGSITTTSTTFGSVDFGVAPNANSARMMIDGYAASDATNGDSEWKYKLKDLRNLIGIFNGHFLGTGGPWKYVNKNTFTRTDGGSVLCGVGNVQGIDYYSNCGQTPYGGPGGNDDPSNGAAILRLAVSPSTGTAKAYLLSTNSGNYLGSNGWYFQASPYDHFGDAPFAPVQFIQKSIYPKGWPKR